MELCLGVLIGSAVVLSVGDLRRRRLPNAATIPAMLAATIMAVSSTLRGDVTVGCGLAVALAVYTAGFLTGGCGGGDVKLAGVLGASVGGVMPTLVMIVLAQAATVVIAVLTRARRTSARPHAPPLIAAAIAVVIATGA